MRRRPEGAVRTLGADAVKPVRGGAAVARGHHLPATPSAPAITKPMGTAGEVSAPAALPPLYARWMSEILPGAVPSEPHATCDDCAMSRGPREAPDAGAAFYDRAVKCCTLVPILPNFLVGAILSDTDDDPSVVQGRRSVLERIQSRRSVTPLGLGRPLGAALHYRHHPERFGRSLALRCPHFVEDGGRCGIWRHRDATCATWFCKHERGVAAFRFWDALRSLLSNAEHELSLWCAVELGLDTEPVRRAHEAGSASMWTEKGTFTSHLASREPGRGFGLPSADERAALWGEWQGREREFYEAAAHLASALEWKDIAAWTGGRLAPAADALVRHHAALRSTAIPERLASRRLELGIVQIGRNRARVDSYRWQDPQEVPRELLDTLVYFDGRSTADALEAMEREAGLRLEMDLVQKLVDFGLVADATAGGPERGPS